MAPTRKLTGAAATLFANICEHYIEAAESACNDTPDYVPIFSWLSPHQRLALVREVMIGVLCEDEPLPPDTIQHNATYRAMIEILFSNLEVEMDMQWDCGDVGDDLLEYDEADPRYNNLTPEEKMERGVKIDLMEYRAEKNMNKMKKKKVGDFKVEPEEVKDDKYLSEKVQQMSEDMMKLFAGGPISRRERSKMRPLTKDEEHAFRWRRLMDAALQEDERSFFPLCNVNFDFRCQKESKWKDAINLLLDTSVIQYGSPTDRALVNGSIDASTYADPQKLPRIRAIEKHVEILRKVYEATWDSKKMSYDQRCIFSVCSNERYYGYAHRTWVEAFITQCQQRGVDFPKKGNYQARLDTFRAMTDGDFTEGLEVPFGSFSPHQAANQMENWIPSKFTPEWKFEGVHCHGPGTGKYALNYCFEMDNLKACSRCKVAVYCSEECQRKHWKTHKAACAKLAADRKDKQKIAQMAKDL
mmetsp:Transcript_14653/g.35339  ORF Transcript_14653/g.35339 Transcript_14653/m.35339 type:complete len:471 (+) Transcript_14653:87-1499(+)